MDSRELVRIAGSSKHLSNKGGALVNNAISTTNTSNYPTVIATFENRMQQTQKMLQMKSMAAAKQENQ